MKREKEVPEDLLKYLKSRNEKRKAMEKLNIFCTHPVKAVKMKILDNDFCKRKNIDDGTRYEGFRTVIIPAIDVYVSNRPFLKPGYLKRDAISFFVAGTRTPLPYGHIYADSGYVCLGSIFVPSGIPERAATMPIETLFLHNDRNLSHGNSHLYISEGQYREIRRIIERSNIRIQTSTLADRVIPKRDIIQNDEIWNLSADVVEQRSLPDALSIMEEIYAVIFPKGLKADGSIEKDGQENNGEV